MEVSDRWRHFSPKTFNFHCRPSRSALLASLAPRDGLTTPGGLVAVSMGGAAALLVHFLTCDRLTQVNGQSFRDVYPPRGKLSQ